MVLLLVAFLISFGFGGLFFCRDVRHMQLILSLLEGFYDNYFELLQCLMKGD